MRTELQISEQNSVCMVKNIYICFDKPIIYTIYRLYLGEGGGGQTAAHGLLAFDKTQHFEVFFYVAQ